MANPMLNSGPMLARGLAQSRASEPTYAALRTALAAGTYQAGQMVFVEGRAAAGDGGQGPFQVKYDAGGGFVDDGGVTLTSEDGKWAAERIFDGDVNAKWFGLSADGSAADNSTAIQAALNYARSIVQSSATGVSDDDWPIKGGLRVRMHEGLFAVNSFEVPETVELVGASRLSTLLVSSYNGQIIRNKVDSGDGTYDKAGLQLADFSLRGDLAQTSQVGIDLLRPFDSKISRVNVYKCGGDGLIIRQGISCEIEQVTVSYCGGNGIVIDSGVNTWADQTANSMPSNANRVVNCHAYGNDGAGLKITGAASGNQIVGGAYELNGFSLGNNLGYNIEVDATTLVPNVLENVWTEGPVKSHIYINHASSSSETHISNWKHFGNGVSGNVDRALICDRGVARVQRAYGHGDSYKDISGSVKPFRVDVSGGDAAVTVLDCFGSGISDGRFLEDGSGAVVSTMFQRIEARPITGIDFDSTVANTDTQVLDDYEEGAWTPVLQTDGVDFDSVTYDSIVYGKYTKIGNLVHFQGVMYTDAVTATSATGYLQIGGLPFTSAGNASGKQDGYSAVVISAASSWASTHPSSGYVPNGANAFYLTSRSASDGATALMTKTAVGTGTNANLLRFSGTYLAAS